MKKLKQIGISLKNFIVSIIDIPRLIGVMYISLWVCLLILVLMKLLMNKWYPIICENTIFINIGNYLDNNEIPKLIVYSISYMFTTSVTFLTCIKQMKLKHWYSYILLFFIIILTFLAKYFNTIIGTICEFIVLITIPVVHNVLSKTFKHWWINLIFPLVINLLLFLWQLNILFVRDTLDFNNIDSLTSLILQIDHYIFLLITWIGVNYIMGLLGPWLFSKDLIGLKAQKELELKKDNPNKAYLAELDKRIALLEKNND